jgi:hypothetical protein
MDEKDDKKKRKSGKRSPGYPFLGLEEAIRRAMILWDKDKNNSMPIEVVYEHLGYGFVGGYGGRIIAAMKHFDLISEEKDGMKLTSNAVDLALHQPSDERYIEIVKELALKPVIYDKLFNEYKGNLPSDATLKIKLIKDYEFNPDKVDGFLSDFKKTIEFANLDKAEETHRTEIPTVPGVVTAKGQGTLNRGDVVSKENKVNIGERIIATYTIGRGLTARIIISGDQPTTIESIEKLLNRMQEDKEIMIESIANAKDESTKN